MLIRDGQCISLKLKLIEIRQTHFLKRINTTGVTSKERQFAQIIGNSSELF